MKKRRDAKCVFAGQTNALNHVQLIYLVCVYLHHIVFNIPPIKKLFHQTDARGSHSNWSKSGIPFLKEHRDWRTYVCISWKRLRFQTIT